MWAHAVGADGKVTGLEFSEEYAKAARDVFERNGIKNAEVIQGDALQTSVTPVPLVTLLVARSVDASFCLANDRLAQTSTAET